MSSRKEFVLLAQQEGANIRALCRQFSISPKTGYKLLNRYAALGEAGLLDYSRQPHTSPKGRSHRAFGPGSDNLSSHFTDTCG